MLLLELKKKKTKTKKKNNIDSRIRSIICKGPKYTFPFLIDFKQCREEIAVLNDFGIRWCKREY